MLSFNTLSNNDIGLQLIYFVYETTVINCTIRNNTNGIHVGSTIFGNTLMNNAVVFNSDQGLNISSPLLETFDIQHNWWGHKSGPNHPIHNPGGRGDPITDYADFDPWLKSWPDPDLFRSDSDPANDDADNDDDADNEMGDVIFFLLIISLGFLFLLLAIVVSRPASGLRSPLPLPDTRKRSTPTSPSIHMSSSPIAPSSPSGSFTPYGPFSSNEQSTPFPSSAPEINGGPFLESSISNGGDKDESWAKPPE